MPTTRRELLRLGLGGSTLLACSAAVPSFLARSAEAIASGPKPGTDGRILVVVQLDGGNDGLNTVVPFADDIYRARRPRLALKKKDVKPIDDHVGLHPDLGDFAKLLEDGRLAIVQSVGYPNPNRSHFESMAIWQTARLDAPDEAPGWLARRPRRRPAGGRRRLSGPAHRRRGPAPSPERRAAVRPLALPPRPVPSPPRPARVGRRAVEQRREALDRIAARGDEAENPLLQFVARSTLVSYASSARVEEALRDGKDSADYPAFYDLARRLRLISRLIRAGLDTSIYYVHLGGFDTHADQLGRHAGLLRELGRSLRAFQTDLDRSGLGDRVVVLVFSEFGRRLRENASGGTDHGTAAPAFLVGRPVRGGLQGPYPDLADLADGDPKHAIDFRRIYATLLDRWFGLPSVDLLGGSFEPLPLIRS